LRYGAIFEDGVKHFRTHTERIYIQSHLKMQMTSWTKLSEVSNIEDETGVYIVRWIINGVPQKIGRLGGIDSKGILYIGSAKNLKKRTKRLWRGVKEQKPIHTAARSYIFTNNYDFIDPKDIEITTIVFDRLHEARTQEWNALKYYGNRFKELPPLNLIVGRKRFAVVGISKVGSSKVGTEINDKLKILIDF